MLKKKISRNLDQTVEVIPCGSILSRWDVKQFINIY